MHTCSLEDSVSTETAALAAAQLGLPLRHIEQVTVRVRTRTVTWAPVRAFQVWDAAVPDGHLRLFVESSQVGKVWASPDKWWRILDVSGRAYSVESVMTTGLGDVFAVVRPVASTAVDRRHTGTEGSAK